MLTRSRLLIIIVLPARPFSEVPFGQRMQTEERNESDNLKLTHMFRFPRDLLVIDFGLHLSASGKQMIRKDEASSESQERV